MYKSGRYLKWQNNQGAPDPRKNSDPVLDPRKNSDLVLDPRKNSDPVLDPRKSSDPAQQHANNPSDAPPSRFQKSKYPVCFQEPKLFFFRLPLVFPFFQVYSSSDSVSDPFSFNPNQATNLNPDPSSFLTLPGININYFIITV